MTFRPGRRLPALVLALVTGLAPLGLAAGSASAGVAHSKVVSANPQDNTPHVVDVDSPADRDDAPDDNYVYAIAQVGNKIIAGGVFDHVRDNGSSKQIPRRNIFAFDRYTGKVDLSFKPVLDGQVRTLVAGADGASVYVGGTFGTVNGTRRYKLVKLRTSDGSVVTGFNPGIIDKAVYDAKLVAGRLFVGGEFESVGGRSRQRLAELDPATGALKPLSLAITGTHNGGTTQVYKLAVANGRMVITGNFSSVAGQTRYQVAMVNVAVSPPTLVNWAAPDFAAICTTSSVFPFYVRDVDFSPDGKYFVIVTTGTHGGGPPKLCDTATRWETGATGTNVQETWANYTGGDTLHSVNVTGAAVYVGGHQRWMNNPEGRNNAGPGAIERSGIAALAAADGAVLPWNPGRWDRGRGVFELLSTGAGLWVGSDTSTIGGETHGLIAFMPLA
ncbi:MAG: hypothetical protein M3Q27_10765 [Actinomycetota bacterium]|nr:hypothetical protein [Actinomycetota bacterium]